MKAHTYATRALITKHYQLSTRTRNLLDTHSIKTIGQLDRLDLNEFRMEKGVGATTIRELHKVQQSIHAAQETSSLPSGFSTKTKAELVQEITYTLALAALEGKRFPVAVQYAVDRVLNWANDKA